MNMKLFSLVSGDDIPATKLQIKISGSLNAFTDDDVNFSRFSSLKEMFPSLGQALKSAELIVIAVEPKSYNKTKQMLIKALSLNGNENSAAKSVLDRANGLSDDEKAEYAFMPNDAIPFLTRDGINSGFIITKGHQQIMYLPLDDERLDAVLRNGVIPYLTSGETMPESEEKPFAKVAPAVPEEPVKPEPEKVPEAPSYTTVQSSDIAGKTVNILREEKSSVAINGNQNSEYVKSFGDTAADFFDFFSFTPHVEDKGDFNVTDYTAQMAKSAKELASATYGACISDICDTDDCSYICIAVAGDTSALVRKLYKEPNETDESFIKDAAEELIALIGEKASGSSSVGIEISGGNMGYDEPIEKPKKSKKALISIIIIILAAALCVGAFFLVKYEKDKKAKAEVAAAALTQTTTEVTVPETEPVTVPKTTVSLSMMMYNEALNGIDKDDISAVSSDSETTAAGAISTVTTTANANKIPDYIMLNGVKTDAKQAISKIVASEIDDNYNAEAIKAEAVAVYTYLKYRNTNFTVSGLTAADAYSDNIYNAVSAVFGEYVSYNSEVAFTPWFKSSAGKTTSADVVFGKSYPYLKTVDSANDKSIDGYKTDKTYSSVQMREMIEKYDNTVKLSDTPKDWIKVTKHDGAINTGVGYVETVTVGGKEISGFTFVKDLLGNDIPSYCFAITYTASTDTFKITSYGNGFGVGMSLAGANKMAATGSNYSQILAKYYPGTKLS